MFVLKRVRTRIDAKHNPSQPVPHTIPAGFPWLPGGGRHPRKLLRHSAVTRMK